MTTKNKKALIELNVGLILFGLIALFGYFTRVEPSPDLYDIPSGYEQKNQNIC